MKSARSSTKYNKLFNQMNQNFIENSMNYERSNKQVKKEKIILEI